MAILVAHRGFRSKIGENRMIDFINALKICQAVEFDIRMTKDKKIIIFHDGNFKRIGQLNEKVRKLTYQQITEITFFKKNPDFLPPLLIDDFTKKLAKKYQMINIEIKPDNYTKKEFLIIEQALITLHKQTEAQIIISAISANVLNFITTLDSQFFKKGYLIKNLTKIDQQLIKKFDFFHPHLETIKQKNNVEKIKKINLPMNIWTFKNQNDVDSINELYEKKLINSYISDIPDLKFN